MGDIRLGARLQSVADLVKNCKAVADIGTDHAYLPLALVQCGKVERAIAIDLKPGPCEAARKSVSAAGEEQRVEVRLGDGIRALVPGEVETICIAGMGGALIARILSDAPDGLDRAERLVLQPMNRAGQLRTWLYQAGWHLEDEVLAEEGGHIYEAFSACKGRQETPSPVLLQVGPLLWEKKPPLLRQHIEGLLSSARRRAEGMAQGARTRGTHGHIACLEEIRELEGLLEW